MKRKPTKSEPKRARNRPGAVQVLPPKFKQGFLKPMDKRRADVRFLTNLHQRLTDDLGGADQLSTQRSILAARAVHITALLANDERRLLAGDAGVDVGGYCARVNCLLGVLRTLGLDRAAKQLPSLAEYARQLDEQEASVPSAS